MLAREAPVIGRCVPWSCPKSSMPHKHLPLANMGAVVKKGVQNKVKEEIQNAIGKKTYWAKKQNKNNFIMVFKVK